MDKATANKEIVRRYFNLVNRGEIGAYLALLAEDFVLRGHGMPASNLAYRFGKQDLAAHAADYEKRFAKRITLTIGDMIAEGDRVALEATSSAQLADGRPYGNQYSFHVLLRDGLIAEMDEYCCTYSVVKDLLSHGVGTALTRTS